MSKIAVNDPDKDIEKFPRLRTDLKISKMTQRGHSHYVVKDSLKGSYFRFDQEEWQIIELFDGTRSLEEMVSTYNNQKTVLQSQAIDIATIKDYKDSLNSLNLLQKNLRETNIMLIEKMKEMRKGHLLSKKGSIMYKRFPLIDPDNFFNKIIPYLQFFWTKQFFFVSAAMMIAAIVIILANWTVFSLGVYDLFSFKGMSFFHGLTLWFAIYLTIAIHEFGHGLTCKRYGGEVHEIGFLLLFFQPCLYCNVNDAWIFDKKWKQILVTIAGGYIEFWIGSIFTFIWVLSSPNTFINLISFQIMTICSLSTVLFNLNPLVKLDGYYLLSDFVGIPNLKDDSVAYIKYLFSKYLFAMDDNKDDFSNSSDQDKIIYVVYGVLSIFWTVGMLLGLIVMAKNIFVEKFYAGGILLSAAVAYKFMGSYFTKGGRFLIQWYLKNIKIFKEKKLKIKLAIAIIFLLLSLFVPIHYTITGDCTLEASSQKIIRALVDGKLVQFNVNDGDYIKAKTTIARFENFTFDYDKAIASLALEKLQLKLRNTLNERGDIQSIKKEIEAKETELAEKQKNINNLLLVYDENQSKQDIISIPEQTKKERKYFFTGEEVAKVIAIEKLFTVIRVPEQETQFLKEQLPIKFKLQSNPLVTYHGYINKIRPSSIEDPINPKRKLYNAEIMIINNGDLRPGMEGKAKIFGQNVMIIQYLLFKLATMLRLDLFY